VTGPPGDGAEAGTASLVSAFNFQSPVTGDMVFGFPLMARGLRQRHSPWLVKEVWMQESVVFGPIGADDRLRVTFTAVNIYS